MTAKNQTSPAKSIFFVNENLGWIVGPKGTISVYDNTNPTGVEVNPGFNHQITDYRLHKNYPNPFNPSTNIVFDIPNSEHVILNIYNVLGQKIEVVIDEYKLAGQYKVQFDGQSLPTGIYYYQIISGDFQKVRKMIHIK